MPIGTRKRHLPTNYSATRRQDSDLRTDDGGLVYEAATIFAVDSTNSFDDSGSGLPVFDAGSRVVVTGFSNNSREYIVTSSTTSSLVVRGATVVNESAGNKIMIRSA